MHDPAPPTESEQGKACRSCGKDNEEATALEAIYEGEPHHFCSPDCQAKFEADPERYVGETQALCRPPGYS